MLLPVPFIFHSISLGAPSLYWHSCHYLSWALLLLCQPSLLQSLTAKRAWHQFAFLAQEIFYEVPLFVSAIYG